MARHQTTSQAQARFLINAAASQHTTGHHPLPRELANVILRFAGLFPPHYAPAQLALPPSATMHFPPESHPALTPPVHAKVSPILSVPCEVCRQIFAEFLPAKDKVILPITPTSDAVWNSEEAKTQRRQDQRNLITTATLLTLNGTLKDELVEVIYTERTFAVHVFEGIKDGGIEFLNAGRQPLAYKDEFRDSRFAKFSEANEFGFGRMKKIEITIFPSKTNNRHTSMWTYYMMVALVQMMDRGPGQKMTYLRISFAEQTERATSGRNAIMNSENYWWDPTAQRARTSSIHSLANVELILMPFERLAGQVHNARISLPAKVKADAHIVAITQRLANMLIGGLSDVGQSDNNLDFNLECARIAMEQYVFTHIFGKKALSIPKLSDADFMVSEEHDLVASEEHSLNADEHGVKRILSPGNEDGLAKRRRSDSFSSKDMSDEDVVDQVKMLSAYEAKVSRQPVGGNWNDGFTTPPLRIKDTGDASGPLLPSERKMMSSMRSSSKSRLAETKVSPVLRDTNPAEQETLLHQVGQVFMKVSFKKRITSMVPRAVSAKQKQKTDFQVKATSSRPDQSDRNQTQSAMSPQFQGDGYDVPQAQPGAATNNSTASYQSSASSASSIRATSFVDGRHNEQGSDTSAAGSFLRRSASDPGLDSLMMDDSDISTADAGYVGRNSEARKKTARSMSNSRPF